MPENIEEIQESTESTEATEEQEPLDFDNAESRMTFLKAQLNDLVDGINNVYGQDLMDELLKRLEKTVEDFNQEVSGLIGKLKSGKIFDEDQPDEGAKSIGSDDDFESIADEKPLEDQDDEDSDIIRRMRKRITQD